MNSRKINDSEFVVKLTDMMREYSQVVNWSQDGTQIQIRNLDMFCEKILPLYFRHSNINSFIRQLNIYNFYKTTTTTNAASFKNEIFRKGNEHNFFLIQRGRKFKDLDNFKDRFQKQCEQLINEVNSKRQLSQQTKSAIISLLEYKYTSHVNLRRIRCELSAMVKQVKDSRNKRIQQQCKLIKSSLTSLISQSLLQSKRIDEFICKNFSRQYSQTKQVTEQVFNEKLQGDRGLQQENVQLMSCQLKNNMKSFNSVQCLFEEIKQKNHRQLFLLQPTLYLPYHSQSSFMMLPSYIPAPSFIPLDSGMSFFQHQSCSKQRQFDNNSQRDINLNDNDGDDEVDSGSMSFVKIFPQDGESRQLRDNDAK